MLVAEEAGDGVTSKVPLGDCVVKKGWEGVRSGVSVPIPLLGVAGRGVGVG